jgi:DNA topoisomerase-1
MSTAEKAGLEYVTDAMPGIRRRRHGRGFKYVGPDGSAVRDRAMLKRIHGLVIPPAWSDVWICPKADGHIQVTARDIRGRKQYRYHPRFRARRDETKFERMFVLADVLWRVRERVEHDIKLPGLPRDKVMATVLWLLERTLIRIGANEYLKANKSYGLTTLRRRHVAIKGADIRFEFRGKSGKTHSVAVSDQRVAGIVQRCIQLPGPELFQYLDDAGKRQTVIAEDVNRYLQEISGRDITAKDFRTFAGTMLAAEALRGVGAAPTKKEAARNVLDAVDATCNRLGNTRAVCRKYYIHPMLLDAYMRGQVLPPQAKAAWKKRKPRGPALRQHETEVLSFLKAQLGGEKEKRSA